jgi:two-component sensor histidine kinase
MDVSIPSEHAEALRLAVHELAVNAVKFGPFGEQGGSLTVRWWVEGGADEITLNIDWRERCAGSAAARPEKPGFGLTYLEQALPFQLNARTTVEFAPGGLRCQMVVPLPGRPVQATPATAGWERARPHARAEHAGGGGPEPRLVMLKTGGALGDGR